jgi:hypothetical protein
LRYGASATAACRTTNDNLRRTGEARGCGPPPFACESTAAYATVRRAGVALAGEAEVDLPLDKGPLPGRS